MPTEEPKQPRKPRAKKAQVTEVPVETTEIPAAKPKPTRVKRAVKATEPIEVPAETSAALVLDPECYYRRTWCNECKAFEVMRQDESTGLLLCMKCGSEEPHTDYEDLPIEAVIEQRGRFLKFDDNAKVTDLNSIVTYNASKNINKYISGVIIESDAGYMSNHAEFLDFVQQVMSNYRNDVHRTEAQLKAVGRNGKCLCGSGLKTKKCCLTTFKRPISNKWSEPLNLAFAEFHDNILKVHTINLSKAIYAANNLTFGLVPKQVIGPLAQDGESTPTV